MAAPAGSAKAQVQTLDFTQRGAIEESGAPTRSLRESGLKP